VGLVIRIWRIENFLLKCKAKKSWRENSDNEAGSEK